jgi:hypothetical protein
VKPRWQCRDLFEAIVTDHEERTFLLPRTKYLIRWQEGFCLQDSAGDLWRPCEREYLCDLASVPHPLTLLPCFIPTRYQRSAALHDYACRHGRLEVFYMPEGVWRSIRVPRPAADTIFADGLQAEGAWAITRRAYYGGVRLGAGGSAVRRALRF